MKVLAWILVVLVVLVVAYSAYCAWCSVRRLLQVKKLKARRRQQIREQCSKEMKGIYFARMLDELTFDK